MIARMIRQTDYTLLEQMRITDLEVETRKELLGFTSADAQCLARFRSVIRDCIDEALKELYERQMQIDDMAVVIGDADTLRRMQAAEKTYVLDFFEGEYGIEYVDSRLHIGLVIKRLGIDPKLYLAATKIIRDILFQRITTADVDSIARAAAQSALDKLIFFDVTLVFETYVRGMVNEIELNKDRVVRYARALEQRVADRTAELEKLSRLDPLTGLYNRRVLTETLLREVRIAERNGKPLCVVYFDVDDFKIINDTQGHDRGDVVLKEIADTMRMVSRNVDLCFRLGGDEFCVLLTDSTESHAREIYCERLMELVARRLNGLHLSIGLAQTGPDKYDEPDDLIRRADGAMYEAKRVAKARSQTPSAASAPATLPSLSVSGLQSAM